VFFSLIVFLLFLLQFIYLPAGASYFEIPKVYAAEGAIFLLLLQKILFGKFQLKKQRISMLICLGCIVLLSVFHLLFSQTPYTFFGNQFRMQGTFTLWLLIIFAILSSFESLKRLSPFFVFFVIVVQFILAFFVNSGSLARAVGSLGEPNSLAGEMIFLWPFIFFAMSKTKFRRFALVIVFCFVGITLLLSGSRSGMIAFALQILLVGLMKLTHFSLRKITILCLTLLVLCYTFPLFEQGSLYENRGEVWTTALVAGFTHPLFGTGFGNTEVFLHQATLKLHNHLQGYYVDSSHNIFLDWFVEGGIVGLGLFASLLFQTFSRFVTAKQERNLVLLLGLTAGLSFNPVSIVLLIAFWWLIGQGMVNDGKKVSL